MVYIEPPMRTMQGGTIKDADFLKEISAAALLDPKMKLANRYSKLLKTILLRPVWRKGKMDLDILTPDIVDVSYGDTPEQLESVLITHYPNSNKYDEVTYSLWTDEVFQRLDYQGSVLETQDNPYHMLTFIPIWDRIPTSDFWLSGGDDLIIIQEAINEKLTDLMYVLRMQGFGQGYIKGETSSPFGITVGPGSMTQLPIDGEIGYVATHAPIEQILDSIRFLIKQSAVMNGLSASSLNTEPSEESGISKIISNRELEELRRDDIELFRGYEHQLFNLFRIIWNTHNPTKKISENSQLQIDFYDPKPQTSPKDQAETWERQLDMGIISQVDIVMEKNPDLKSREDALAYLLKIQEERETLNQREL